MASGLVMLTLYSLFQCHFSAPVPYQTSVIFWRGFIMPAQLYFDYFDFFKNHAPDYFAQSFPFDQFSVSLFDRKIPYLIGDLYLLPNKNIHANANFWADLFVNSGYWSFLIGTAFLLLFLGIIDFASTQKNKLIVVTFSATSLIGLLNGPFIANLITNGMLLMLLLIILMPKEKNQIAEL